MKRQRIFAFDLIRILAMIFIIVFHYNTYLVECKIDASPLLFVQYANGTMGTIGVSLFFILSGASLMYVYQDRLVWKEYLKKRFLSIYPIYWIAYAAVFSYFYILHRLPMPYPRPTLLLSFLGMDGYLYYKIPCYYLIGEWFVGCIILLYLLFPLLRRLILKWPRAAAAAVLLLYIPYLRFYSLDMEIARFVLTRIPEFLLGMYFVLLLSKKEALPGASPTACVVGLRPISWRAGIPALTLFILTLTFSLPLPEPLVIFLTGSSCFVLLAWLSQLLDRAWAAKLCAPMSLCSFSIFLFHHVVVGSLLTRLQGASLGFSQNHLLFGCYFLAICVTGLIFYQLSQLFCALLKPLLKQI